MVKILFFLGILIFFLLFPLSTGREYQTPTGTPVSLVDPGGAAPQQSLQMRTVTVVVPTPTPTPRQCQSGDKVAVDLLLDTSGSMCETDATSGFGGCVDYGVVPPDSKINKLKDAVKAFSRTLQSDDLVGIQAFNDSASVKLPIGLYDQSSFDPAVDSLYPDGPTNMREGFVIAKAAIDGAFRASPNHTWALILVSDGKPNLGSPPNPLLNPNIPQQIKDLGVIIITIGLGQDRVPDLLQNIASSKPTGGKYYYDSPSSATLDGIYDKIAQFALCR